MTLVGYPFTAGEFLLEEADSRRIEACAGCHEWNVLPAGASHKLKLADKDAPPQRKIGLASSPHGGLLFGTVAAPSDLSNEGISLPGSYCTWHPLFSLGRRLSYVLVSE